MLLKGVLSFYQQDNNNQQLLKEKSSNFRRGSVAIRYCSPSTLPDAANFAKEGWEKLLMKLSKIPS